MGCLILCINNDGIPKFHRAIIALDRYFFKFGICNRDVALLNEDEIALAGKSVADNDLLGCSGVFSSVGARKSLFERALGYLLHLAVDHSLDELAASVGVSNLDRHLVLVSRIFGVGCG